MTVLGEGGTRATSSDLPGRSAAAWLGSWVWVPAMPLGATVLPAIYPTGHAAGRSPGGRPVGWTGSLLAGPRSRCSTTPTSRSPRPTPSATTRSPVGTSSRHFVAVAFVAAALVEVVLVVVTFVWTLRRLRRRGIARARAAGLADRRGGALMVGALLNSPVVMFGPPCSPRWRSSIGIVRYQLFDIKLVLRSGLVYGC